MTRAELTHMGLMLLGAAAALTVVSLAPLRDAALALRFGAGIALVLAVTILAASRLMR